MSEDQGHIRHLLAISRVLGSVDALERWLDSVKAEVQDTRAQDDGRETKRGNNNNVAQATRIEPEQPAARKGHRP